MVMLMKYPEFYCQVDTLGISNKSSIATMFFDVEKQEAETNTRYMELLGLLEELPEDEDTVFAKEQIREIMADEENHGTRAREVANRLSGIREAKD